MEKENTVLTEPMYYILLALFEPMHGYGVMKTVEALSEKRVKLSAGTLYGVIAKLQDRHWIEALPTEEESRKKKYIITDEGKLVVQAELLRLRELVDNGIRVIEGTQPLSFSDEEN